MHVEGGGGRSPPSPGLLVSPCQGGSCSQTFGSHYKHPRLIPISSVRSLKQQIPGNFGRVPWQRETQRNGGERSPLRQAAEGPLISESWGAMGSQPRGVQGKADTGGSGGLSPDTPTSRSPRTGKAAGPPPASHPPNSLNCICLFLLRCLSLQRLSSGPHHLLSFLSLFLSSLFLSPLSLLFSVPLVTFYHLFYRFSPLSLSLHPVSLCLYVHLCVLLSFFVSVPYQCPLPIPLPLTPQTPSCHPSLHASLPLCPSLSTPRLPVPIQPFQTASLSQSGSSALHPRRSQDCREPPSS